MKEFLNKLKNINISKIVKKKKTKQIASLYTSMVLGSIIGIGISVINTRLLGPKQYGDLKFLQNLFSFVLTFLTLGLFVSGTRLVAQKKKREYKKSIGWKSVNISSIYFYCINYRTFYILFF